MPANNKHLYALVAGELSGDTRGAGLMRAILRRDPKASFIGIGGPKMIALGMSDKFSIDVLSVMGIAEVVSHLLPILRLRSQLVHELIAARPCVMIGIDSPDFNLTVETKLKQAGIPTLHYVSPSVWAWREGRMKKIKAACCEVLALLPFEKDFYAKEKMPCTYVGHTLANSIPFATDQEQARERIGLYRNSVDPVEGKVLAILPGSRRGIISRMLPLYTQAARLIRRKMPDVSFVAVVPNHERAILMKDLWLEHAPDLSITIYVGNSQDVIASADACLLTCGTIAFEAMLLKKPMTVAYRVNLLSAAIARRLLHVNMFSLPNLLAKRRIVNEFIQDDCTADKLAEDVLKLLNSDNLLLKQEFLNIHRAIRTNADELAAEAVMRVIRESGAQLADSGSGPAGTADAGAEVHEHREPSFVIPKEFSESSSTRRDPNF